MRLLLLPYILLLGGIWFGGNAARTVCTPPERAPSTVSLWSLTPQTPDRKWIKVTGGGHYLAGASYQEYTRRHRFRSSTVETDYYVPLLTNTEALRWHALHGKPPKDTKHVVLVRYSGKEFDLAFPNALTSVQNGRDLLRVRDVQGVRLESLTPEMKRHFSKQWNIKPESLLLIDANVEPLSPADAYNILLLSVAAVIGGGVWIYFRHVYVPSTEVPAGDLPPVPEMPAGGWFAKDSSEKQQGHKLA